MNTVKDISKALAREFERFVLNNPQVLSEISKVFHGQTPKRPAGEEMDKTIANLEIQLENDSAVVIRWPGKRAVPYDCRHLGFRDQYAKPWRFFVEVLTSPPHRFHFGPAYCYPEQDRRKRLKNKDYDVRWRLCDELCKKLILFFENEFGEPFPPGYKLYRKSPLGTSGEREFKFQIRRPTGEVFPGGNQSLEAGESEFREMEEVDLISRINRLSDDFSFIPDSEVPDKLITACKVGQEKFGWTPRKVKQILEV